MAFDWREYLELAKGLAGESGASYSVEAAQRAAVSRAYYAAFCWVRNFAGTRLGFVSKRRPEDHTRLRDHLKTQGRTKLASYLNQLREWRNHCDYEDDVPGLSVCVKHAINIAERAIRECR